MIYLVISDQMGPIPVISEVTIVVDETIIAELEIGIEVIEKRVANPRTQGFFICLILD